VLVDRPAAEFQFLQKPFTAATLLEKVREILASVSRASND
jgi:hypothetical protein